MLKNKVNMKKNIKIDVTNLVKKIKEQNLLFYPVMIYIMTKALLKCGHKNITPAYLNTAQNGCVSILSQKFTDSFESFFQEYVTNCFYNDTIAEKEKNQILFSYIDPKQLSVTEKRPILYMLPLEQKEDKSYLSFCATDIEIDETFTLLCQELCDSF